MTGLASGLPLQMLAVLVVCSDYADNEGEKSTTLYSYLFTIHEALPQNL